jgi:hypothetical protein
MLSLFIYVRDDRNLSVYSSRKVGFINHAYSSLFINKNS